VLSIANDPIHLPVLSGCYVWQVNADRSLNSLGFGSDAVDAVDALFERALNWELSSRRATGVLRFFKDGGLPAQEYNIMAVGLADTQPVTPNTTEDGKQQNWRIVISSLT
jgi:chemotaxis protein MotB